MAFHDLSGDRPLGAMGGAGRIPWAAVDRYAARYGIHDPDEFDRLVSVIRAMDGVYLKVTTELQKAAQPKKPPPPQPKQKAS